MMSIVQQKKSNGPIESELFLSHKLSDLPIITIGSAWEKYNHLSVLLITVNFICVFYLKLL